MSKPFFALLAVCVAMSALLPAQETSPPATQSWPFEVSVSTTESRKAIRPSRVALDIVFDSNSTFEADQKGTIRQSIEVMLSPGPKDTWILVENSPPAAEAHSGTDSQASPEHDLAPDLIYHVDIQGSMNAMTAQAALLDASVPAGAETQARRTASCSGKVDRYFRNAYAGLWVPLRKPLQDTVKAVAEYDRILVKALPGSRVSIEGECSVEVGPTGGFYTTIRVPSNLIIHSRNSLAADNTEQFYVESGRTIELQQARRPPVSFSAYLHWLAYPGISAQIAASDFIDLGIWSDWFILGLLPSSPSAGTAGLVSTYNRIDLGLEARFWTDRQTADFRAGFSVGAGLHFDTLGTSVLDSYIPFSVQIGLPVELYLGSGMYLDLELLPTLNWTTDPDLALHALALNQQAAASPSAYNVTAVLGNFIFEPFHFRLGVRIQP